jgi:superfamily II DNA or RNA helicase
MPVALETEDRNTTAPAEVSTLPLRDFLGTFADQLEAKVERILQPIYRMQEMEDDFGAGVKPYAVQREVVKGIGAAFRHGAKAIFLVGEMGTGKTLMCVWASRLARAKRTLVVPPPHLVEKWRSEILAAYPDKRVAVIPDGNLRKLGISNFALLRELHKSGSADFVVISREAIKTDFPVKAVWVTSRSKSGNLCPSCFERIDYDTFLMMPKKKCFCPKCKGALFQYRRDGNRGRPSLAKYIQRKMKGFFDFIVFDEVHEYKAEGTAQGAVLGKLGGKALTLAATGTLMGGRASDIFHLLMRMAPRQMRQEGFEYNSATDFVRRYGVLEKVVDLDEADNKLSIGRRRRGETERERPGLSPLVVGVFLIDKAVFVRLSDFAEKLPLFNEHPVPCRLHPKLEEGYSSLLRYKDALRDCINPAKIQSSAIQALLAYPDTHGPEEIYDDGGGEEGPQLVLEAPWADIPVGETEKEWKFLEIVKNARSRGKKVLVYTTQSNKRDLQPRIKKLLDMHGIRSTILTRKVSTAGRERWIRANAPKVDVLICHPRLVATGLDLLEFPVIVFFDTGYSTYLLRQASRRSLRINQKEPEIDVYYLYTAGTLQQDCLSLMAVKNEVSLMAEGEIQEGGLSAMASAGGSIMSELAKVINGQLKTENPLEVFARINKKNNEGKSSAKPEIPARHEAPVIEVPVTPPPLHTVVTRTGQLVIQF